MHPTNPNILLAGTGNNAYPDGGGVYLTTNGSNSWQAVIQDDNINALEFALSNPDVAYAGSSRAIYRSNNRGQTWYKVSVSPGEEGWGSPGVRAGFPIDLQVDPRNPNRIFANNYGGYAIQRDYLDLHSSFSMIVTPPAPWTRSRFGMQELIKRGK